MRIYIAGPITGDPDFLGKFIDAEMEIRACYKGNVEIVNPAYMDKTISSFSHREQVDFCFQLLEGCDMIYLLEGWEKSLGAQAEYGFAKGRRISVLEQTPRRHETMCEPRESEAPEEPVGGGGKDSGREKQRLLHAHMQSVRKGIPDKQNECYAL